MTEKKDTNLERSVINALYKNVLIDQGNHGAEPAPIAHQVASKSIRVIAFSSNGKLSQAQQTFLAAILKACQITMHEIDLICVVKGATNAIQMNAGNHYSKTLMFGITPEEIGLPIRFPHFQIQQFEKTIYLSAPDLTTIENDKKMKVDLWHCLQKIFM